MEDRQGPQPAPQMLNEEAAGLSAGEDRHITGNKPENREEVAGKGRICVPLVFCADAP